MITEKILKPVLVLDEKKCRQNIKQMTLRAKRWNVLFRPHFKTHQSAVIGNWFREEGVNAITVSSVTMAGYFISRGWNDITIAFPLNPRETGILRNMVINYPVTVNILTSGPEHLRAITEKPGFPAGCFIKLDTGYKRTGIEWDDKSQLVRMAAEINKSDSLRLKGLLVHAGHTYSASSPEEIAGIFAESSEKAQQARSYIGYGDIILSAGDTPSCSIVDHPGYFDEMRPGNFVFYDLTQAELGSCNRDQIAVAVFCPVVDVNRRRKEVLIYGGGVHLSKEALLTREGRKVFGEIAFPAGDGWSFPEKRIFLERITQEHGIISVPDGMMDLFRTGSLIAVIPVHSCMTADAHRRYLTTDGREIEDFSPK